MPPVTPSKPKPSSGSSSVGGGGGDPFSAVQNFLDYYQKHTPQRTKLIDVFMAFLVIVGGLQFLYCALAGNYVS